MFKRLEAILGRSLDPEKYHAVASLNDVSLGMLQDLRFLIAEQGGYAYLYLRYHLTIDHVGFDEFLRDVVAGGADPKKWGYRDIVVHVDERDTVVELTAEAARNELAVLEGEKWVCESIDNAMEVSKSAYESSWGAPGVLIRRAPYHWRTPSTPNKTLKSLHLSGEGGLAIPIAHIPTGKFEIAYRRWIAFRASWWAKQAAVDLHSINVSELAAALKYDPDRINADAQIAMSALLREAHVPFDPQVHVHGFVGPDDWYGDP